MLHLWLISINLFREFDLDEVLSFIKFHHRVHQRENSQKSRGNLIPVGSGKQAVCLVCM